MGQSERTFELWNIKRILSALPKKIILYRTAKKKTNMTSPSKPRTLLPKQPISKPIKYSKPLNPSAHPADLQLKSTIIPTGSRQRPEDRSGSKQKGEKEALEDQGDREDEMEVPVIEFDSSKAPQPFLDGDEVLERMRALGR
ncbi:hypothetical protein EMPG_17426 [Blastomyces silverae]|uniref:Uncharacterized protein n=1 Tax=Blastomyces silverae TaxID=2060906 RepID=A0A0H1B6L1_9EURO|nr:hypothetical protein EMPG_17426 [Blastomyces silverae]